MLLPRVIPCLDVKGGRVVKGIRFQGLRDAGDPVERAAAYARQGADELVLLDVSATPEDRGNALEVVRAVRRVLPLPLTVGGGVRAAADAERLLEAGADKVAVNTAAVARPGLLGELAATFGRQCTVLALDAARRGASPGPSAPALWAEAEASLAVDADPAARALVCGAAARLAIQEGALARAERWIEAGGEGHDGGGLLRLAALELAQADGRPSAQAAEACLESLRGDPLDPAGALAALTAAGHSGPLLEAWARRLAAAG
jgi:hypothetical protein